MPSPIRRISLLLALLLPACDKGAAPPGPPAATTSATSTAPATPRIVSTVPAATLNLVLIGGDKSLVGVSTFDHIFLPPDEQTLPVVGDYEQTNYQQLVKLAPTAMIIQSRDIAPRLQEFAADHHIELLNMNFDHVDDIWTSVRTLAKAAHREQQAELAITRAQQDLKDIAFDYKDAPHPRVLYIMDPHDNTACGNHTFVAEMIAAAGGINAPVGDGFVSVNRETMVKLAPDVLLIGAPDALEEQPNDPRLAPWLSLPVPAARNGRLYLVTDGNSQMPSLDIGKNVRALAALIHRNSPPIPPTPAGTPGGGP